MEIFKKQRRNLYQEDPAMAVLVCGSQRVRAPLPLGSPEVRGVTFLFITVFIHRAPLLNTLNITLTNISITTYQMIVIVKAVTLCDKPTENYHLNLQLRSASGSLIESFRFAV